MKSKVSEIHLNPSYLIHKQEEHLDYVDVFQLKSKLLTNTEEPKDCMIAFFKAFPNSFKVLLNLREAIAKKLGLKTAPQSNPTTRLEKLHAFKGDIGESVAIFEVLEKNNTELVTGQKDKHLDFKLAFISYRELEPCIELVTTVKINNRLGKIYFAIVRPIHRFYMKRLLLKMETILLNKDW